MRQAGTKIRILTALAASFLIIGLYFVFVYQGLPFLYDINDDVAMRNVAAGVITGEPDAHLIFIKYLLGLVISGLYRLFPGIDWYGLVMVGIMLLSFFVLLYRGLVSEKGILWKLGYTLLGLLLFTAIGVQHVTAFQWTVAAAMAGASGIYLFHTSETEDRFQSLLEEGAAVFLLLLCFLVRESVFLMMLPVAAACFWWKYGSFAKSGRLPITLKHWAVPFALGVGVFLITCVELIAYHAKEWKEFLTFNVDRSAIMDYYELKNYEEQPEFYDMLGLSPEEVENLQRYSLYLAEDVYGEKMHLLAENAKKAYQEENPAPIRFWRGMEKVYEHLNKESYGPVHILSFCILALVLGLSYGKSRRQFWLGALISGILGLFWIYLGFQGRVVDRVGYAMYLLTLFTMLAIGYRVLIIEERKQKSRMLSAGLTLISCLLLAVLSCIKWSEVKSYNTWRRDYNLEFLDVNRYMAEHPENVYFMTTYSIETYTDNFTIRRDFAFSNLLSVGGWHTFSPLENEKNRKLGISDPKRDMVEKENVYLISLENIGLGYMDRYFESLYGEEYLGRELADTLTYGERTFEVYDFRK